MTTFTESGHPGACVISEATGNRSRDNLTLASGQVVKANQVLGKITATSKYAAHDNNASDGTEVAKAISLYDADATSADLAISAITRDAEVNGDELYYKVTSPVADQAQAAVDLALVGIIVR